MRAILLIIMVLAIPDSVRSEVEAFKKLLETTTLKCIFGPGQIAHWDTGTVRVKNVSSENFTIHFDSIKPNARTARSIGNLGAGDVELRVTSLGLTFIEETLAGNLIFTTVFASYDGNGEFMAVTSRHMGSMGRLGPFPQQYFGFCTSWG